MVLDIDKDNKCVYIWLANNEKNDNSTATKVSTLIKNFSGQKYTTVIFKSGHEDLETLTANLLKHNKGITPDK